MAIKVKNTNEIKPSKIKEIMSTEYKWETYLLGFLSLVAIALGLLIFSNILKYFSLFPCISDITYIIGSPLSLRYFDKNNAVISFFQQFI